MSQPGRSDPLPAAAANGRNRRILPVRARSGGGRLTERTPASALLAGTAQSALKLPLQGRPRVAEVDVSHICTSLKMADVAMPHQMFADIPSLIARLRSPFSGQERRWVRCEATRDEMCHAGGSTACRARRAVAFSGRLSERPRLTITGTSGG